MVLGYMSELNALRELASSIANEELRRVVCSILDNPLLSFTSVKPLITLEESPAAPRKHHFFKGGLAVHTLSVVKIALALSNVLSEVYGLEVNRDLVVATAILHDIYKYYQYAQDTVYGGYKPREDWYLSHDYAVVAELARRGAPEELIRAVSEVHGLVPFTTLEGLIVHLSDSVDARLGEILQNMVLNRVRDYEARNCQLYKALNNMIENHGLKYVLRLVFNNPDELRELFEKECNTRSSQ